MRTRLTIQRINAFACEPGKSQSFLFDDQERHLAVRVTRAGSKSFVFEGWLGGSLRMTIGSVTVWNLDQARQEARRLQILIDQGIDPRQEKRARVEAGAAKKKAETLAAVTVAEAWGDFVVDRSRNWGKERLRIASKMAQGPGVTSRGAERVPGPLYALMGMRLADVDGAALKGWVTAEAKTRPLHLCNAFGFWMSFVYWARATKYGSLLKPLDPDVRRYVPKRKAKSDALLREQLPAFFDALSYEVDPIVRTAIAVLLLTGQRKTSILGLRWADIDFKWKTLAISDKVDGSRVVPMTPFVERLLEDLPRRGQFVFPGKSVVGHLTNINQAVARVCHRAGIPHLSVHGLRRSYGSLAEWMDCPAGVVAQLMGHKPSATAEKHYRVRPLDLLREWATKIEGWILAESNQSDSNE